MKLMIIVVWLVLSVSCSNSTESSSAQDYEQDDKIENHLLAPAEFNKKMSDKNVVVLDVRTPEEVAERVIGNPLVINYFDEDFKKQMQSLDKSKTYLVYCKSGGRSGKAKAFMDANGFESVFDLDGGITAWEATDLSTD